MTILTRSDEILMLAILRLDNNAYGVSVIKEVERRTGKKLTFGSLWVSLDIMCKRGFVKKRTADPTPQRGGRSKIYYSLTPKGIRVLEETRQFQKTLWEGVPARLKT